MSEMKQEEGVYPQGPYTAWAEPNGIRAEVRKGNRVVKKMSGEMAWSDAVRLAGDKNSEIPREDR